MHIKTVSTPYATTTRNVTEKTPLAKGVFDSYEETMMFTSQYHPPLDQKLKPGESREALNQRTNAHAHVTLTSGLNVPIHRIKRAGVDEGEAFGGPHEAWNKQAQSVAEISVGVLQLGSGSVALSLREPNFTQTILEDGTTTFTDQQGQWNLHADGHATVGTALKTPVEATLDPDGSVAFYTGGVPTKVFMPVLPLAEYLALPPNTPAAG